MRSQGCAHGMSWEPGWVLWTHGPFVPRCPGTQGGMPRDPTAGATGLVALKRIVIRSSSNSSAYIQGMGARATQHIHWQSPQGIHTYTYVCTYVYMHKWWVHLCMHMYLFNVKVFYCFSHLCLTNRYNNIRSKNVINDLLIILSILMTLIRSLTILLLSLYQYVR